jgi:hypothetical protein
LDDLCDDDFLSCFWTFLEEGSEDDEEDRSEEHFPRVHVFLECPKPPQSLHLFWRFLEEVVLTETCSLELIWTTIFSPE